MEAQRVTASEQELALATGRVLDVRRSVVELACLIGLVELIMWVVPLTPRPRLAYAGFAVVIAMLLALCRVREGLDLRALGVRIDNLFVVVKQLAPPLILFVALVVVIGWSFGTLRFGKKFFTMLLVVPWWALLQQYMLLGFAHPRIRALLGEGWQTTAATAAMFALLHLPNPVLTVACAAGGYLWTRQHGREPNLLANALTHTIASAFLANTLPGWLLKNMVVGYNYFLR